MSDREELKQMVKELLAELIAESQEPVVGPEEPTPYSVDKIGLLEVADFYDEVSEFLAGLDSGLRVRGHELNTCGAYTLLSDIITRCMERGWLESDDWAAIADICLERADIFLDDDSPVPLPRIKEDRVRWASDLDRIMRLWDPPKGFIRDQPSADDLPLHTKVARIRSAIQYLKDYHVLDGNWPWVGKLIYDLDVVYKIHKPNVTNTSGSGGYSAPWG